MLSKLPLELQQAIWEMTLEPRLVELQYSDDIGFYSAVPTPVALRVCQRSRGFVKRFYPICFGNIMFEPQTVFNIFLDTLYLGRPFQDSVFHLFASLTSREIDSLQYLAVDYRIDEEYCTGGALEIDPSVALELVVPKLPFLKEIQIVHDLGYWNRENCVEGRGHMQLFKQIPATLLERHPCKWETNLPGDVCDCEYDILPSWESTAWNIESTRIKVSSIWGWRPLELR